MPMQKDKRKKRVYNIQDNILQKDFVHKMIES